VRQESAAAFLKLQNNNTITAVNTHGNRTNEQLLAQNLHMLQQDQQAARKQEEFAAKLASMGDTITNAIAAGFTGSLQTFTASQAIAAGASQQATTAVANTQLQYPQTSYSTPHGGWDAGPSHLNKWHKSCRTW
jgi:hypothetical protein